MGVFNSPRKYTSYNAYNDNLSSNAIDNAVEPRGNPYGQQARIDYVMARRADWKSKRLAPDGFASPSRSQQFAEALRITREGTARRGNNKSIGHAADGPSYKGLLYGEIASAATFDSGTKQIYGVKLRTGGKKTNSNVTIQNAIVSDDSADVLSVGESVMVWIDGNGPPKIVSGAGSAATVCVRNLGETAWFN